MTKTTEGKKVSDGEIRPELDPMFYQDLETFRKAVEDGTIDRQKGCRNMAEYLWSVNRASV